MRFVLGMAWRETRASWGRLLFFFVCVGLGVAAIVILRSVVQTVRTTLTTEARLLVGADVVVQAQRDFTTDLAPMAGTLLADPRVRAHTAVIETQTMARPAGAAGASAGPRLVELRGVEPAFPYYGAPELEGGRPYDHTLLEHGGILVDRDLLRRFGINVGGQILLAAQPFTVRGVVVRDRVQRSGGVAFGPRVYLDLADLRALSIFKFGSRATYQILLRVDAGAVEAVTDAARAVFQGQTVTVRSWRSVEDRVGQNLQTAENYLSLVGFAMVVLGGIGVWSVTRVVVTQKIRSVAILKCLGATSGRVLATYVLQVLWLAAGGSALGVALAAIGIQFIPERVITSLGVASAAVTVSAAGQGVIVGLLVSLLFALVPLLEVRRVKPLLLLRTDTAGSARRRDARSVLAGVGVLVALALTAIWQAGSVRAGLYVSAGLTVVGLALLGASWLLVAAVRPLAKSSRFAVRHAIVSLRRPNNQTRVILLSVGLGCFFILAVRAIQLNLLHEFAVQIGGHAPDLVLIDVQDDQVQPVSDAVAPFVSEPARLVPMLRARVVGVDGRRVQLATVEDVRQQGELAREYSLTYRDALQPNETVVSGAFWNGPIPAGEHAGDTDTEVSMEQGEAGRAHVGVGDVMRFEFAGRALSARVTSLRSVSWDEAQNGGFIFVLRPGPAMARLPKTRLGFLNLGPSPDARVAAENAIGAVAPNVSVIDVRDVLASIREVLANATLGVTIVGAVTIVAGVLILIGAVAMTRFERLYAAAIYRTLGAGTRLLLSMVAIEYGLLGLLAGLLGAAGALGLSYALAVGLFEIAWIPAPGLLATGVVVTAITVCLVGVLASASTVVSKPLGTLRGE